VFGEAGFDEVVPPLLERAELFDAGRAVRALDSRGRVLAVRADFTAQTARIAATRLHDRPSLRLWYRGSVLRDADGRGEAAAELRQAGCEIIGDPTPEADAEALALASRALHALGLAHARLSVGSVAFFEACLAEARIGASDAAGFRDAVDRKDRSGVAALAAALPARVRDALEFLAAPEPRERALELARGLAPNDAARAAVDRLAGAVAAAQKRGLSPELEVDLGEVRGMGYYTGLVFNAFVEGAPFAVGGGGRYDGLLGRFGDARPAVGFSLDLDTIVPLASLPLRA
jgi:ATP phosphoribosyltransferase regulatory subunit